jgi:hypothetical protein
MINRNGMERNGIYVYGSGSKRGMLRGNRKRSGRNGTGRRKQSRESENRVGRNWRRVGRSRRIYRQGRTGRGTRVKRRGNYRGTRGKLVRGKGGERGYMAWKTTGGNTDGRRFCGAGMRRIAKGKMGIGMLRRYRTV